MCESLLILCCEQPLVFVGEQFYKRVETELQQWQPEQQQQDEQQLRSCLPQIMTLDLFRPPTVEDVFHAYYDCRKSKRNSWNALKFEENLERNLIQLHKELREMTWEPSRLSCFVVTFPKPREIWASDFRDRVAQYVFYNRWKDRFHNSFIYDTYACIPGRGTLMGSKRVQKMMRSVSDNYQKPAFVGKIDFANFFVSIDKQILQNILFRRIKNDWDRWICLKILWTDVRSNPLIKSSKELLAKIPVHKSLLRTPSHLGLPIGNLTSQFFANIYLNEVDQYSKHKLKARYYGRYVDDIVIFHESRQNLAAIIANLDAFAQHNLSISLHPRKTSINKVEHGVNFVGYVVKPWRKYIRRSTLSNLARKMEDKIFWKEDDIIASANSYLGMLRHVNGYSARKKVCQRFDWLGYNSDRQLTKLIA